MMEWHSIDIQKIYSELKSSESGLNSEDAKQRIFEHGQNTIEIEKKISLLSIFLGQFKNIPVLLLLFAALVSFSIGITSNDEENLFDSILIFLIVIGNAIFGFAQEYKAEKSLEALKKMVVRTATVVREGKETEIDSKLLVPGDVIILKEGDVVPADSRIFECYSLHADESVLTGESVPSQKNALTIANVSSLADRKNMLYMNTNITRGKAKAIIVATGLRTEVGKIAKEISDAVEKVTSFQVETEDLGKKISIAVLVIILIIAGTELFLRQGNILGIFLIAISLGVAAIPEGLPAVVTLSLAFGANKMVKQNALIRKLGTIQNFSALDVVCSDKTGTMTENSMTVTKIYFDQKIIDVSGKGQSLEGVFSYNEKTFNTDSIKLLFNSAILCNDSSLKENGKFSGDPTEIAVLIPSYKAKFDVDKIKSDYKRINENPFSSDRKLMSTLNQTNSGAFVFVKGAPEVLLSKCNYILEEGKERKFSKKDADAILEKNNNFASNALRVLGFAYKKAKPNLLVDDFESDLIFLGLMGMIDPPRDGVKEAIFDCKAAGIRVVMITGDNKITAEAVGLEVGLVGSAISGDELDNLDETSLRNIVEKINIYARTSPLHKVKILKALQANKHVVAMTGDGVNDAAAVKNADVGIAMGIRGTDVTKGASDIILLDDNFITIKNAIREGRGIYDNIRKFVVYLLGANLAEVLVIFVASIFGLGLPLLAIHLLWINLLTDGLPALALGVDPPAQNIMQRKPRKNGESIINKDAMHFVLFLGVSATISYLALFSYFLPQGI